MCMSNNPNIVAGYLEGTIKGQLDSVELLRSVGLASDKELLDQMIERLKNALDTVKKGI
jgi:hypothetical protein